MKNISFLIVVLLTFASYTIAQKSVNLVFGTTVGFSHYYAPQMLFINTTYQIGAELELNKGSMILSGAYNLNLVNEFSGRQCLSFLGINAKYRVLKNTKIISPTLSLSLFTEVRNKGKEFIDYKTPREVINSDGNILIYNDVYLNTPFLGSLLIGFHVHLQKNWSIALEGGYGYRYVKYQTRKMRKGGIIVNMSNHSDYFQSLDVKLGFNYTFSFVPTTKKAKTL